MSDDPLQDIADKNEQFKFILDFTDGLPKEYNTVDIALSRIGETEPIEVVGNITAIPQPEPVQRTRQDYEDGSAEHMQDKTLFFFHMTGESSFTLICALHNVVHLTKFPYGKDNDDFSQIIQKIQYAYKNGRKVQVVGKYVSIVSNRKEVRVVYVDTVNIEDDSLSCKMLESQFERFITLCEKDSVNPVDVFMKEIFVTFDADDYLMKMVAIFCLTPKSREEMIHILLLSAPGEGKDYLIDTIIQPMVTCGKVEGESSTTVASLVGAMSSKDLTSLGVGVLQRYHNERLAVSEVQTWGSAKFGALLGMMANGYVNISKGKMQDVKRPACENILLAGNIPNNWKEGMKHWDKLDSVLGGKNKAYSKQMISRMTVIFAKVSLLKNPDPVKKARMMVQNMDDNSAIKENELFDNDDIIKSFCSRTDISNREKSQNIRERMVQLLRMVGKTDDEIVRMLRQRAFQTFFGHYFKFVSLLNVRVGPVGDVIYRVMMSMVKREEFGLILCNESGDLDARKFQQFMNLCKAFAKIHGHRDIQPSDISEAEMLFKESGATLVEDFGIALLTSGLDIVELDIIKFIAEKGAATKDEIRAHIKVSGADDRFFTKNLDAVQPYLEEIAGKFLLKLEAIPEGIKNELEIQATDTISEKDAQMRGGISDDEAENRLTDVNLDNLEVG